MNTLQSKKTNKTSKKYINIINCGTIQENEIIALRSFLNRNKESRPLIWEALGDKELTLTPEHIQKGYDFLMKCWKTPTGVTRKNNPFGYREQEILENFRDFTLKGLYDAGNSVIDNYLPLYSCNSKDGNSFEYYYNGEINIVG